jgi:23S rRNA pseudouridine2605 synthase
VLDGRRTAPARARLIDRQESGSTQATVEIALHEGRQRQVRRMFDEIGHPVARLRRVRIGPIEDPQMPLGHWRDLTPMEVAKLQRAAGIATSLRPKHKGTKAQGHKEENS